MDFALMAKLSLGTAVACFIAALLMACDVPQYQCGERACKPDWSGDCYCSHDQTMERQPDGVIICRCKDAGR